MDKEQIIEALSQMNVFEIVELTKALEDKWGVTAAAPVAFAAPVAGAGAAAAEVEEQTEFDALLTEVGPEKIKVIKVVRELTNLGLKEAKALVDGAPAPVKEKVSKEEAETIKTKLSEVGATVQVK